MKKPLSTNSLGNQRGFATIETLPILIVFVVLLAYSFGVFGIVHTGILNSIAARTYAFETIRNRTNASYFRDGPQGAGAGRHHFQKMGNRVNGILQEADGDDARDGFRATERPLRIGFGSVENDGSRDRSTLHNSDLYEGVLDGQQTTVGVSPVWIKSMYGICMNAKCGE